MHPVRTWIVLLTVNAIPAEDQLDKLRSDLPDYAEVFVGSLRTGFAFNIRSRTQARAHARAMHAMIDIYAYLGNTPVDSVQTYDENAWGDGMDSGIAETFNALLFGPPSQNAYVAEVVTAMASSPEEP